MMPVVAQRKDGDCGLAALASYLVLDYEDVYAAALKINPKMAKEGALLRELQAIAKSFGRPLRIVRKPDPDHDCGVLGLLENKGTSGAGHYVILRRGQIFDVQPPSAFDVDDYLLRYDMRPGFLLTEESGSAM